jgi:hypothetical protein
MNALNTTTRRSNPLKTDGNLVAAQMLRDLDSAAAQLVDGVVLFDSQFRLGLAGAATPGLLSGFRIWLWG